MSNLIEKIKWFNNRKKKMHIIHKDAARLYWRAKDPDIEALAKLIMDISK